MKEARRSAPVTTAAKPAVRGGEVLDEEGLTPAERTFADAYVRLTCEPGERFPQRAAAIEAGTPEKGASVSAHRWLRQPNVTAYIARQLRPAVERVELTPEFMAFEALTGLRKAQADGHHAAAARYLEILNRIHDASDPSKRGVAVPLDVNLAALAPQEKVAFLDMLRRVGLPADT